MSLCEMCGKKDVSVIALVEGTELKVCNDCSKYGKIIRKVQYQQPPIQKTIKPQHQLKEEEKIEVIVEGFGNIIRQAREKLNLNQEDFGKKINEKTSVIHSLESEHHEPSLELAKKLEKLLKVKLVEEQKIEEVNFSNSKNQITIGDIIKIR
jgi:putative transcription factor